MPISIAGSGTITGISVGGIPDGVVDTDVLAANAVTTAKLGSAEQSGLCKAWVNFNGTGTVAIRASYNVSSITDNGTGDYTVNFTTALADANYSLVGATGGYNGASSGSSNAVVRINLANLTALTTTTARITTGHTDGNLTDYPNVCVAIFR
jgi:hypothetical protein